MKNVFIAAVLMFSASAFALDANSSWEEINASYKTDVKAPQVFFAAGEATSAVSIFDTCIAGNLVKTIAPKNVYTQVRHGKNDVELVVIGQEILSTPKTFTKHVTTDKNSSSFDYVYTVPVLNNIEVYTKVQKSQEAQLLFTKSFSIPTCN